MVLSEGRGSAGAPVEVDWKARRVDRRARGLAWLGLGRGCLGLGLGSPTIALALALAYP